MVAKLSSASTMSAACLETSVPAIPMATPMAACCSAGASLTPSPVIAATSPSPCSCLSNRCLSAGSARQKTMLLVVSSWFCAASGSAKNSPPTKTRPSSGSPSAKTPTSRAMAEAVGA
eukprot:scaffold63781_cov63-Phaeocystis_antarctica.AAC.1